MATKCQCKHCHKHFNKRPQNPNQKYCSEPACQKARRRTWQKEKMQTDPQYRENQRDTGRRWRENNPDYQREYRERNQEYTERNRVQQRVRNQRNTKQSALESIVNMDASNSNNRVSPGRYELRRVVHGEIVNMDVSMVEINVISPCYENPL